MIHAAMYHGSFERNFDALKPGAAEFEGADGKAHAIPPWPSSADGVRIGYMEKRGKKFLAVRVLFGDTDVVLPHPVVLDLPRHFGYGKRLGPEPTRIDDDSVILTLIEDMLRKNPDLRSQLMPVRAALKRSMTKV